MIEIPVYADPSTTEFIRDKIYFLGMLGCDVWIPLFEEREDLLFSLRDPEE